MVAALTHARRQQGTSWLVWTLHRSMRSRAGRAAWSQVKKGIQGPLKCSFSIEHVEALEFWGELK